MEGEAPAKPILAQAAYNSKSSFFDNLTKGSGGGTAGGRGAEKSCVCVCVCVLCVCVFARQRLAPG